MRTQPWLLVAFAALSLCLEPPLPGYRVSDVSWKIEVFEGQPPLLLNGTVQEIYSEIMRLNPEYKLAPYQLPPDGTAEERHLTERGPAGDTSLGVAYGRVSNTSEKASELPPNAEGSHMACWNYPVAECAAIQTGILYLYGVTGSPNSGPGPNACARVSCSDDSSVWWCNDNSHGIKLDNFGLIAHGAGMIINQCFACRSKGRKKLGNGEGVAGHRIFDGGWRVIVKEDKC